MDDADSVSGVPRWPVVIPPSGLLSEFATISSPSPIRHLRVVEAPGAFDSAADRGLVGNRG